MSRRRVVITGIGVSSSAGAGVGAFWSACVEGRTTLRRDPRYGSRALEPPPVGLYPGALRPDEDRGSALALAAASEALRDARFGAGRLPALGIVVGTCLGSTIETFNWLDGRRDADGSRVVPSPPGILCRPAWRLATEFGVRGPVISVSSACSSGFGAIAQAMACIRRGETDCMLAGGVDVVSTFVLAGFRAMGALTSAQVRPFDRRRDGTALGEGAGMLILEERSRAMARGTPILAELIGIGSAGDAESCAIPEQAAAGLARAIMAALEKADVGPDRIDFVSAQGTGTVHGDRVEAMAIKATFGELRARVAVSSHKPIVGHTLGAAGALSAILCVLVLCKGILPPLVNRKYPDAGCDFDFVGDRARASEVNIALALSSGFAGHHAALLVGRG